MPVKQITRMAEEDKELRLFERRWVAANKRAEKSRDKEPVAKFLTEELLRDRKAITKNGRQKLVLQYGTSGQVEYTLADLNAMAKKLFAAEDKFGTNVRGVKVGDLLTASLFIDKKRAKKIRSAALYKVAGNTLFFQTASSGETPGAPSHYVVRVRLEDWGTAIRRGEGKDYYPAAIKAAMGNISFDCSCGRHQYWYRYLATIGGFALMPKELVYPKIRNPKLKGACCKHTLKTIMTMQGPVMLTRIAHEMEKQAKKTNFEEGRGKFVKADEAEKLRQQSEKVKMTSAFKAFKQAQAAFQEKQQSAAAKKAIAGLKERNDATMRKIIQERQAAEMVARKEIQKNKQLQADMAKQWAGTLKTLAMTGTPIETSIDLLAKNTGTDKAVLMQIAEKEGLL